LNSKQNLNQQNQKGKKKKRKEKKKEKRRTLPGAYLAVAAQQEPKAQPKTAAQHRPVPLRFG
jgi:hypothetical protein